MKWPDKGDTERPLESIIGYSDGGDFALRLGPQPADDSSSGRFADLVQSRVVATKDKEGQQQEQPQKTNVAGDNPLSESSPRMRPLPVDNSSSGHFADLMQAE